MTKILISPGYGAGWSTWNDGDKEFLLKDPTLVKMAERMAPVTEVDDYLKATKPEVSFYTGGWMQIEAIDIPEGEQFKVTEYDGYESVEYRDSDGWIVA